MTLRELMDWGMKFQMKRLSLQELRQELEGIVKATVKEFENKNQVKTHSTFEIYSMEKLKRQKEKGMGLNPIH